jgi:hypothetical protein
MLSRSAIRTLAAPSSRLFSSSSARLTKVAVLGAGGGIGQPLSLLLKSDPLVTSLSLYDIRGAPGVAADVSHVDTASEACFFLLSTMVRPVVTCKNLNRSPGTLLIHWTRHWKGFRLL